MWIFKQGFCESDLSFLFKIVFYLFKEPISEAAALLLCYSGICFVRSHGSLLFDGCFPHPVRHVKSAPSSPGLWQPSESCLRVVCVGVMTVVHFFQVLVVDGWQTKWKSMYCKNVFNYRIKIHVFHYLKQLWGFLFIDFIFNLTSGWVAFYVNMSMFTWVMPSFLHSLWKPKMWFVPKEQIIIVGW